MSQKVAARFSFFMVNNVYITERYNIQGEFQNLINNTRPWINTV